MTILERILETKRAEVAQARKRRPFAEFRAQIARQPPPRDFYAAVTTPSPWGINLIAEIKKASPSAGVIVEDFDPVRIAKTYAAHGACALSVLTDETYFQGRLSYIEDVRRAVELPVLRKDFIIDEYQVYESRAAGADAILLIAAAVPDSMQRSRLIRTANDFGMAVLIEVHTEEELNHVHCYGIGVAPPNLLGINNRDLHAQRTDLAVTERLAAMFDAPHLPPQLQPKRVPFVSESGIVTREDVLRVQRAGATAILVGESLLKSPDPGAKIDELLGSNDRAR